MLKKAAGIVQGEDGDHKANQWTCELLAHALDTIIEGPAIPTVQVALLFDKKVRRDRVEIAGQYT